MADQDNYSDIQQEVNESDEKAQDPESVLRGHKATISNPNTSEQAKQRSRRVVEDEFGEAYEGRSTTGTHDKPKDPGNVARGLKATIHNPRVSEEAKERAKEKLEHLQ